KHRSRWVEDAFVFDEATGKQVAAPKSHRYVGTSVNRKTAMWLGIVIALLMSVVLGKVIYLQILNGGYYSELANKNRERAIPIKAERGIIYDRNDVPLTQNIPNFSLTLVPQDLPKGEANKEKREEIIARLATLTNRTQEDIRNTLNEY